MTVDQFFQLVDKIPRDVPIAVKTGNRFYDLQILPYSAALYDAENNELTLTLREYGVPRPVLLSHLQLYAAQYVSCDSVLLVQKFGGEIAQVNRLRYIPVPDDGIGGDARIILFTENDPN
jgi:hypothetical protein